MEQVRKEVVGGGTRLKKRSRGRGRRQGRRERGEDRMNKYALKSLLIREVGQQWNLLHSNSNNNVSINFYFGPFVQPRIGTL